MLKTNATLEHRIGDRVYQLVCAHDSPLSEVKEALAEFTWYAINVGKQGAPASSTDAVVEEPKPEVEAVS